MHASLSTDRMKYYHLLALVCEDLATATIDALVRGGHHATTAQLTAVRQGRRIDLPLLVDLVQAGLPQFAIPAELLPAAVPQPLFAELAG